MASTYRFLALQDDMQLIFDWFARLERAPEIVRVGEGYVFNFSEIGHLGYKTTTAELDAKGSPLVSLFPPETRYDVLWTAAELHFLATPLASQFPELQKVNRRFAAWISAFDVVFEAPRRRGESRNRPGQWDYFLEGTLRNWDTSIYALPAGMAALRGGQ